MQPFYSFFEKKYTFNFRFTHIILYLHLLFSYSEKENEDLVLQQRFQLPCTTLLLYEHYKLKNDLLADIFISSH